MLTEKFHVSSFGYFGSYSAGQQSELSNLDLFLNFLSPWVGVFLLSKAS